MMMIITIIIIIILMMSNKVELKQKRPSLSVQQSTWSAIYLQTPLPLPLKASRLLPPPPLKLIASAQLISVTRVVIQTPSWGALNGFARNAGRVV